MKSAERLIYKAIQSSVVSIEEILHSEKNLNPTIKKKKPMEILPLGSHRTAFWSGE
jgi:hypothetical protein